MTDLTESADISSLKAEQIDHVVRTLFPAHIVRGGDGSAKSAEACLLFSIKELEETIPSMKNKKAPRPDGIPVEVYKLGLKHRLDLLLSASNGSVEDGILPRELEEDGDRIGVGQEFTLEPEFWDAS